MQARRRKGGASGRKEPRPDRPKEQPTTGLARFGRLESRSHAMQAAFERLARFAPTEVSVTVQGETGTGKDVLAHVLHEESRRAGGPFVIFDCGAVASNLAESELFGHERGSFTGAVATHVGAFERANGGTLFLDEIGELPLDLQPRLLRALENRKVRRVGGRTDRELDVRVIAATNRDLLAEVGAGKFRRDLYFRLAGAVLVVPPLRERLEDLPVLAQQLLRDLQRPDLSLTDEALAYLEDHAWPGNVRELKNALAFAATFVPPETHLLGADQLRRALADATPRDGPIERLPLAGQRLDDLERAAIRQTLAKTDGNRSRAAQALGISISTLYEKLKKYRIGSE